MEMKKKTRVLTLGDCMTACGDRNPTRTERVKSAMEYAVAQGEILHVVNSKDEVYFIYK